MTVVPPNLEKGTENVIRERTGSATGIVAEKRRGTETGIRIVKEVTETEIVIATTGIVASAAREGNTVIVLTIVTITVMIVTITGAMILEEQISGHGTGKTFDGAVDPSSSGGTCCWPAEALPPSRAL
jgi:hypothetical protein